jgi:hypothetical protein
MKTLKTLFRSLLVAGVLLASGRAVADSAVLTQSGILYEIFETTYGQVVPDAGSYAPTPVLALRTTLPDGSATVELVDGTVDSNEEWGETAEFDETTQTLFVAYVKNQSGFTADVHFSIHRGNTWREGSFLANAGLYLSLNPRMVITRQKYIDFDGHGGTVQKQRSILHLVWWEESGPSQARYAAVFVEDGQLNIDQIVPYNLNELASAGGPTLSQGLPFSSYMFPAAQRDPSSNGGVTLSFANLVNQRQTILSVGYPDDLTKLSPPGSTTATRDALMRHHTPIGRHVIDFDIPSGIDVPLSTIVGTVLSPSDVPTYYWQDGTKVKVLRGDAVSAPPIAIPLRPDFSLDRALSVVRGMAERQ